MRGAMDWRVLKRAKIKNEGIRLSVSVGNIVMTDEVTKMTNAGGNKFDDSLISSLQLATKLEDAMNRIAKETPSPSSYFSSLIQFNLHIGIKSSHYA